MFKCFDFSFLNLTKNDTHQQPIDIISNQSPINLAAAG